MIDPNIVAFAALRARNDAIRSGQKVDALQKEILQLKHQAKKAKHQAEEAERQKRVAEVRRREDERLRAKAIEQENLSAAIERRQREEALFEKKRIAEEKQRIAEQRARLLGPSPYEQFRPKQKVDEPRANSGATALSEIERVACPRCGEMIAKTAKMCRYCQTEFAAEVVSAVRYFCFVGSEVCGPYQVPQLAAMRSAARIDEHTPCCLEGTEHWFALGSLGT
jgi:hypothetical protein